MPALPARPRALTQRVDHARGLRLLDPRRLHELGLRPRLRALAPGQEARAHAGGADRPRVLGLAAARHAVGPLVEVRCSTAASTSTRASADALDGRARRTASSSTSTPSRRAPAAPASRAARVHGQRRPRGRRRPRHASASSEPPPLYAYDPDIGRLAVTTPTYNTAIVAVNQRAFPYGGLDLARLFDGQQEVAANIGGRPPASFGLLVRDVAGRRVAASQLGRARVDARRAAAAADQGTARRGRDLVAPRSAARTRVRSPTCAPPAPSPRASCSLRVTHRFTPRLDPDELDRDAAGPAAPATPPTCCSRAGAAERRRASSRSCATAPA